MAGLSTIARGVVSVPSALAHPVDSTKGFFAGAARLVDRALVAENTSAITHGRNAAAYLSAASGREIATGLGNAGGNAVLAGGPVKLAGPIRYSPTNTLVVKPIRKNSLAYVGDTHVYVIRAPDGSLYKVGESAQGVRVGDGASIRAEQQARQLLKETGDLYPTEIRQDFGGKADARAYETRFIQTYERLYGQRPPGNPLNR